MAYKHMDMPSTIAENGDLILYDREEEKTHILNGTAKLIYEYCLKLSTDEIVDMIRSNLDNPETISKEEIKGDVEETINNLLNNKIIVKM